MTPTPALRNIVLVATIVAGVLLMASSFPLRMTPEIFDSGYDFTTWSLFLFLWFMPVVLIGGIVIAWMGLSRNSQNMVVLGLALSGLPVAVAAGIIVMAG